ncbi:unnamed protein product [Schistosoma rodhaini]|uniref:SOCS box domain-containing protein n=1 Tax=Schistosoma rodhaini TaxID=6188 RepID=A0AA85GAE9_9TREM|nr:unnamed protein product [Schistosoma rodhaini]
MSYSFDLHESIYGSEPYNTTHFKIPSNQTTTTATTTKHKQNGYVKQFLQQNGMRKTKKSSPLISVNGTGGGIGEQRFDANFKVLLLGNSGVGKTSIIRALVGETFYQTTISTIGIDLIKRIFTVENHRVQLEVWDTAGQEQYHSIVSLHFREAKCFIIVYDVTDMESFEQIRKYWLRTVDETPSLCLSTNPLKRGSKHKIFRFHNECLVCKPLSQNRFVLIPNFPSFYKTCFTFTWMEIFFLFFIFLIDTILLFLIF